MYRARFFTIRHAVKDVSEDISSQKYICTELKKKKKKSKRPNVNQVESFMGC